VVLIHQIRELGWGVGSSFSAEVSPAALRLSLIVWFVGVAAKEVAGDLVGRYEATVLFGDDREVQFVCPALELEQSNEIVSDALLADGAWNRLGNFLWASAKRFDTSAAPKLSVRDLTSIDKM